MTHFDDLIAAHRPPVHYPADRLWAAALTMLILVAAMLSI